MRWLRWLLVALVLGLMLGPFEMPGAQEKPKKLNPYTGNPEAIAEGRKLYIQYGCSGCHGLGGGGGMGPAVLDDQWKFGSDDETLYKLIKGEIPQQTMPAVFGKTLKDDEIWKMITYIRSVYRGDPERIDWALPSAAAPEAPAAPPGAAEKGEPTPTGKAAYATYCLTCHGQGGKGDGPAAAALDPKPRDLSDRAYMAQLDDQYLFHVISKGGAAVGKSPLMPPAALGEQDIQHVIAYLRTLAGTGSP